MIRVVCFILRRLKGKCFPYSVLNLSTHTKMISPGSYRFRLIALTHLGGFTAIAAKIISPCSYRFRLIALTHLGGFTAIGAKMISPGSYRFRLIALTH